MFGRWSLWTDLRCHLGLFSRLLLDRLKIRAPAFRRRGNLVKSESKIDNLLCTTCKSQSWNLSIFNVCISIQCIRQSPCPVTWLSQSLLDIFEAKLQLCRPELAGVWCAFPFGFSTDHRRSSASEEFDNRWLLQLLASRPIQRTVCSESELLIAISLIG